jgi:hypothetical protein
MAFNNERAKQSPAADHDRLMLDAVLTKPR